MVAEEHVLLVLHQPPRAGEVERQGRLFWRNPQGDWKSTDLGTGINALSKHLDQYAEAVAGLDLREEHAASADEYFGILEELMPVTRSIRNLHQCLQECRQAVPNDRDLINLRDRAYEIERASELLEQQLQHRLDYAIARRAEEQTEAAHQMALSSHRLNLLAAMFLPLATLCAVFGMQIDHGIAVADPLLFFIVIVAGVLTGVALTMAVANKR